MARPRDTAPLSDAFDLFLALPRADQLQHHRLSTDYLGLTQRPETDTERQLRRQRETLKALQVVQVEMQLTADRAPTADQFDQVAKRLGLGEDRNTVRRAWGTWSAATATLTGGSPVETAAQKSIRRRIAQRTRTRVEYIEGIGRWLKWLEALPGTPPERRRDYRDYVDEHNATARAGDLLVGPQAAKGAFPLLTWDELKSAARGQLDPYAVHRRRVAAIADHAGSQPFITLRAIAALLGTVTTGAYPVVDDAAFPAPVAMLSGRRVWRTSEVVAHIEPQARQPRAPDETGSVDDVGLLDTTTVSSHIRLAPDVMRHYICKARRTGQWRLMPKPSGKVGDVHYWTNTDLQRWLASPDGRAVMSRRRSDPSAG